MAEGRTTRSRKTAPKGGAKGSGKAKRTTTPRPVPTPPPVAVVEQVVRRAYVAMEAAAHPDDYKKLKGGGGYLDSNVRNFITAKVYRTEDDTLVMQFDCGDVIKMSASKVIEVFTAAAQLPLSDKEIPAEFQEYNSANLDD